MRIWCDVEDLFEFARAVARPSGIQRLSYEMYCAMLSLAGDRVGFVAHDPLQGTMRVVPWADIETIYRRMTRATVHQLPKTEVDAPVALMRTAAARIPALRAAANRLPREVRQPLGEAMRAQIGVFRSMGRVVRAVPHVIAERRREANELPPPPEPEDDVAPPPSSDRNRPDLRDIAQPGDMLASLGSPWSSQDYPGLVAAMKDAAGVRYAMLIYDMIPTTRPEFCDRNLVSAFSTLMRGCFPLADCMMAISESSARDIVAWSRRESVTLRANPRAIPIGTGFAYTDVPQELPDGLVAGGYALFVSTIEARKNHVLAFRAWRALLEQLPPDKVPTLVFAGRVGWMVADLMQTIHNTLHLNGKLVIVENPDDATLVSLYKGARFTLFPSLYEGWGLPVSESLYFGKVCLGANTTSVPEAGGDFCLYHDPDSVTDAVALYRRAIEEPDLIPALERRIAAEYRHTPWTSTAQAVLDAIDATA